jgi:hypothetical protein
LAKKEKKHIELVAGPYFFRLLSSELWPAAARLSSAMWLSSDLIVAVALRSEASVDETTDYG